MIKNDLNQQLKVQKKRGVLVDVAQDWTTPSPPFVFCANLPKHTPPSFLDAEEEKSTGSVTSLISAVLTSSNFLTYKKDIKHEEKLFLLNYCNS